MDDARYGQRDRRGHWHPFKPIEYPAVFVWPVQPAAIARWLFGYPSYLLPWNLLDAVIALCVWLYLTPAVETAARRSRPAGSRWCSRATSR